MHSKTDTQRQGWLVQNFDYAEPTIRTNPPIIDFNTSMQELNFRLVLIGVLNGPRLEKCQT